METAAQLTPFELSDKKETATYDEAIGYYKELDKAYPQAKLLTYGETDFGKPLQLMVLSKDRIFDPHTVRKKNKLVLLINNGIHPGEPEGIDASMMLARDLLDKNLLPAEVVICIIPVYNIDGSHNRGSSSRVNQNGPVAYGFRGNSRNYDLNRDFIKTDTKNSKSFQQIFNIWQPEVFVDTHTSNGADYQYVMTLIPTQKDKLNPVLSNYLIDIMLPALYKEMKSGGYEMIPYVNTAKETPDSGIVGFLESPRYSTGYAALHNTIGFMPETHMLKSYDQRVDATYKLLMIYIDLVARDAKIIRENKKQADKQTAMQKEFPLEWRLNKEIVEDLEFKGYTAKSKPSEISQIDRLYYDRSEPYTKTIANWNGFEPSKSIMKPIAYIIPKAWEKVIDLLKLNGVTIQQLENNQILEVESYYIEDYKTSSKPYEGHYLHSDVKLRPAKQHIQYYQGDFLVYVNQHANRYIVETLEPQATDSFFNWNFFDSVLSMKEHFSAYVFEDTAADLLKKDPELSAKLAEEKKRNTGLNKNAEAQLDFIYKNSAYYEKTHSRYPISRLINDIKIPLR